MNHLNHPTNKRIASSITMLFSVPNPPNISDGSLSIEVIGDPCLLSRHSYDRTNLGRWFISDTPGLREFRNVVQAALQSVNSQLPVFGDDVCLELSMTFHMTRPLDDFDEGYHLKLATMNEFCLDALKGIAFEDKNSIMVLHSGKHSLRSWKRGLVSLSGEGELRGPITIALCSLLLWLILQEVDAMTLPEARCLVRRKLNSATLVRTMQTLFMYEDE